MSLSIQTELNQTCYAANGQAQTIYALVSLRPGAIAGRMPLDLRLVLDRSTSMDEESGAMLGNPQGRKGTGRQATKLEMLKSAVIGIIDLLQDGDQLTIISFNHDYRIDLPPALIGSNQWHNVRGEARRLIGKLKSTGSTRMDKAFAQAVAYPSLPDRIKRVLVFTDGNNTFCDIAHVEESCRDSAAGYDSTMPWLVFGTGIDYNDDFLSSLAAVSGGRYLHISDMGQAAQMFKDELEVIGDIVVTGLVMNAQPVSGAQFSQVNRVVPDIQPLPLSTPNFVSANLGDVDRVRGQKVLFQLEVPPQGPGTYPVAQVRFSYHVPLRKQLNQTAEVRIEAPFTADDSLVHLNQNVFTTVQLSGASQLYTLGMQAATQGELAVASKTLTTVAKIYTRLGQQDLGDQVRTLTNSLVQHGQLTGADEDVKRTLSTLTRYTVVKKVVDGSSTTGQGSGKSAGLQGRSGEGKASKGHTDRTMDAARGRKIVPAPNSEEAK